MPLAGGAASKAGLRYELLWTVRCMIDVMNERAESICLEPPGDEEEGFEFWVRWGDISKYHQVKLRRSGRGHWTLGDLNQERVLPDFWRKLREPGVHCIFVSGHPASELHELAERARSAASCGQFRSSFLATGQVSNEFNKLRGYWENCSEEEAFEALRRVNVATIDGQTLRREVEGHLEACVDGEPASVADVLAQFALANPHRELTASDIWNHLENRAHSRRDWARDRHVVATVNEATDRYLSHLREAAIRGRTIPRDETQMVLDNLISQSAKRGVLLVGEAGVGKSGVLLQVVDKLREQDWPALAFRVDRLVPTQLPKEVGRQIGLPGSPAAVLAGIAQGRDCILVIDQLDAVSLASGRRPSFFDCVGEIIRQAQTHPQMRLLLACRRFDLNNDHRLRRLTAEDGIAQSVTVNRLPHPTVRTVVSELGLDASLLTAKQLNLLSLPLHLSLLAEVAEDSSVRALDFSTARDLYERFWDYKQRVIRGRLGRPVKWAQVIDALCDHMSRGQVLSAPKGILDNWSADAEVMASECVLVEDRKRYSFFHEGFFDYAFARRFAARGEDLLTLLRSGAQHLFRRAQVRQILLYEREVSRERYLADLRALLTRSDVRFHLKEVVFALLGKLIDPTEEEWLVLRPMIRWRKPFGTPLGRIERLILRFCLKAAARVVPTARVLRMQLIRRLWRDFYGQHAWSALYGSEAWFRLLYSLGAIERWLEDKDEERVDQAMRLLSTVLKEVPDRVADLVEPYVGTSGRWQGRLVHLIEWAGPTGALSAGRRLFELFLRLIDEGILFDVRKPAAAGRDFWHTIYSMPQERPEWACEAIGHYLKRCLVLSAAARQPNPFDLCSRTVRGSQFANQVLMQSALGAPSNFVGEVLPFMLEVMELTADKKGEQPWPDAVWRWRHYGRGGFGVDDSLLSAMESALRHLAANEPKAFATLAKELREIGFETVQYLVIRAYTANGREFAEEATDYLCEQPARLETGYLTSPHWATRQLLQAITPYCSDERLARLEDIILNYYRDWERTPNGLEHRGWAQFALLEGIVPSRRSNAVCRRLEEWRRKFRKQTVEPPEGFQMHSVPSPIPASAVDKMTDEHWLKAIARYKRDDERPQRDGRLLGGALELSGDLHRQVKKEPARFAKLVLKFPSGTHPYYFDAVLRGIAEAGLDDVQTVLQVCERCHRLPNRPCGRWLSALFIKLPKLAWPEEALEILAWYATEDPDPRQESWRTNANGGGVYHNGDAFSAGINSVRGSAAEALRELILYDSSRIPHLLPTLERLVHDPSIAVRSCVATTLLAVLNHDQDLAVKLFEKLCETEDVLLKTPHVERFLQYALQTHFESLEPILRRMIVSPESDVQRAGARQACVASLRLEEARPLALSCLSGSDAQRLGAAEVFAWNLREASLHLFCEKSLVKLFDDRDKEVRSETAACFHRFQKEELGQYTSLVKAFVRSRAFTGHQGVLIHALETTTAKLPDITCLVCERFLDAVGSEAADIRMASAGDAHTISKLIIRLYSQTADNGIRTRCLDLIDRMALVTAYGLGEALSLYER